MMVAKIIFPKVLVWLHTLILSQEDELTFRCLRVLWIQAERERHHTIRQAYFEMFSGRKLKDETYDRNWTLNEK